MPDKNFSAFFTGGLNSDDEHRNLPQGDFLNGLNLLSGIRQNGSIVNNFGNTNIAYTLPVGDNVCIGGSRDIKRNAIIYFVWNSLEQHSILHYFCETQTIEEILAPKAMLPITNIPFDTSFLGFTQFNKIHSANVIDDILLWTDGNVHPRKLNIKRAKDFMQQLTPSVVNTPYDNLLATGAESNKLQFINSIKYPPARPCEIELATDVTINTNFIRNKMVQVIYRYIYDDNEKSRWTTGSFTSLPEKQENVNGVISTGVQNNYLKVSINTGHPTVKWVDIAVRFGNLESWQRIDEPIKKYDNENQRILSDYSNYIFDFYNNRTLIPVDVVDTDIGSDAIPLLSETQEIIDGNRLVYANNTEGYENPELNVTTTFGNTLVPMNIVDDTSLLMKLNSVLDPTNGNALCIPYARPTALTEGSVISFDFLYPPTSFNANIKYLVTDDDIANYPINLTENIRKYVNGIAIHLNSGIITNTTITGSLYRQLEYTFASGALFSLPRIIEPTTEVPAFKKGETIQWGIVYYDYAQRNGGVATNAGFKQYIKTFPELFLNAAPVALDDVNAYQSYMDFAINHIPPDWAARYQLVRSKSNLSKYLQFVLKERGVTTAAGNIELDLKYLIDYQNDKLIYGSLNFQFEEGDRLRFIANREYYCPQYVEVKVLAYNTSTKILTVSPFEWNYVYGNMITPTTSEGVLVEYFSYSPTTDPDNQFYYEISEVFDIIDPYTPDRRHQGIVDGVPSNQNAAHTTPARIRLRKGDTYQYRRYFNTTDLERIVESMNFSDYYLSNNFDISRVQGVLNATTKQHQQLLRYGGRYFADTLVNNLLSFDGANFDTLLTTYGPINKIMTVGYVLKVLQTKKLTSIYINRSMIFNADGTPQIALINQVLGTKDPSNTDYGCQHPTSVCKDDRQMYFFDINTGTFIQDSANGPYPISNYQMSTYFKNKSQEIRSVINNDKIFVYASADNFNETINVTFSDENVISAFNNQTILYANRNNRWISFQSYIGDYIVSNALTLVSFKDGQLYVHNDSNAPRCNYYGQQFSSTVKFVCNIDPETVKVFDSIAINSNKLWTSPNDNDITTPPNSSYPLGMTSRLLESKYRKKEGVWYAQYLRDLNTPNVTNPILNGQRLRGPYLIQQLENSDTTEVILYSVIVYSTTS